MNADRLLAHYERIADAPDAIARLRRFILDLAVRGKLVPQDPSNEPALELLKQIEKKKAREIKKGAELSSVPDSNANFPIPAGWAWTTLGTVANVVMGQSPPGATYNKSGEGVPLLNGPVEFSAGPFGITVVNQYTTAPTNFCEEGDLLICVRGSTTGRTNVAGFRACIGRGVAAIRPHFDDAFIRLFIWKSRDSIIGMGRGIAFPSVSRKQIEDLAFPLPPIAEQHRIVAKVDELMALCDRLESARAGREAVRDRLAVASLVRLIAPDPDTFQNDARFSLNALPALTARPDQIRQLRQTILNLAVHGKIVSQNPKDESASELLKRIAEEIPAPKAGENKHEPWPFDVPKTWVWTHLGQLVSHSDAGWSPKTEDYPRSGDEWGVLKVSAVSWDKFRASENKQVLPQTEPRLQAQVKLGDFLISRANTAELVARAVIVDEEPFKLMMSDKIVRLRLSAHCDHRFVWIVNNYAAFSRAHYVRHASGVSPSMKNVSRDVIMTLPFPLPPLAEQHRIVAKVDELMTFCDRLEASLTTTAATRRRLLDALLAEALAPMDAREMEAAE